jgi:DNA polymerase III subunit gamma/tau
LTSEREFCSHNGTEMPSYHVLARKWRPSQLSDVLGQDALVKTLNRAILQERLHHAYLFAGPRGTGKTSIARIFSKLLCCPHRVEHEWLQSCDTCSTCRGISLSQNVDVLEIDGASHNGVESIRQIRESLPYLPMQGKYKIYIIDEVHMLSTAAFNALLKTLEEPPEHVLFMLATTEPHKIPDTILSRCQRFEFRRISTTQIQTRLVKIIEAEGIVAETSALRLLAQAADGSMRDALSLLDQVIAFSGERITSASVRTSIGLLEEEILVGIMQGIFEKKPLDALSKLQEAYDKGHDLQVLATHLLRLLHTIILAKVGASDHEAPLWEEACKLAPLLSLEKIELFFQVFHHAIATLPTESKAVLDVLILKCSTAQTLVRAHVQTAPPHLNWEGFVEKVRQSRPLFASVLEHSSTNTMPSPSEKVLQIFFAPDQAYFREQLQSPLAQKELTQLATEYLGFETKIRIESSTGGSSLAEKKERDLQAKIASVEEKAKNHPVILEAQSLFASQIGPIQIRDSDEDT